MYYKSLTVDRKSWHDLKTEWLPGKPMPILAGGGNGPCGSDSYHFAKSIPQAVGYGKFPLSLWTAEPLGHKLSEDDSKVRYTGGRIIKEVRKPIWIRRTEKFIESIKPVKCMDNHGKISLRWKMHAARAAAEAAAETTAWEAARAAAAGTADRATAGGAARAAAWEAAWRGAGAAARAAALMAQMEICCDLKIPAKHRKCARDRWAVWQAGYGCLCEVDGVLYCYKKMWARFDMHAAKKV